MMIFKFNCPSTNQGTGIYFVKIRYYKDIL
nr:MAG TPA: hypothetical protein [Caudoviricetes sp.]